ncbi:Putative NADH dehydrogenase [ubiquinone] 1 beta subcomplex subunit 8 [Colletotrichum destructivum]|uniref:NADH dehydrogenase [ubiquinone] 1 beta subcomplex subunit 8 n=1 Tax=Colletotrichum destructivum TaxID=34406 RepID=A0AAX4ILG7_9PEZI|nr:Putative NADH dehydrogenase [ubiquinone] 1 beta subcomplex subunit 8 [Colletotrichum destructivum]
MNGGYINPPFIKRQFRDPHGDWWDKQERRNFGEPVHEDHDLLGMFSPFEYTWTSTGKGLLQIGAFVVAFFGVCGVVAANYPDKPSYPREFPDGLERELGGASAVRKGWRCGPMKKSTQEELTTGKTRVNSRAEAPIVGQPPNQQIHMFPGMLCRAV